MMLTGMFWSEIFFKDDFYTNLIAGVVILAIDIGVTYFIISRIIDARQNKRWLPARRQIVEHVLILHQLVLQAVQESLRYNIKKDIDPNEPEQVRFQKEWYLRESFVAPLKFHFIQFEKLLNLYNVSLNSIILSDLTEYYTKCERVIEFVVFAVQSFHADNLDKDFCCPPPLSDIADLELISYRLQEQTGAKLHKMYDTKVSATLISEVLDETNAKHQRLHLSDKVEKAGGIGLLVVPNADIVRKLHIDKSVHQLQTLARTSALR